jgi:myo-inositol-1(or 4)-monophosphatase
VGYNGAVATSQSPAARCFGPAPDRAEPLLQELAEVALEAAEAAASVLAAAAGRQPEGIATKSSATDMVSEVDLGAEAAVAAVLARRRPDDGVLAEEGTSQASSTGVRWVVDPLDGTTNFLFGVPQFCVSIAAEIDDHPVVGVVIDPSRHETWAAVADRPARCNGVPCRVATGRSTLPTALVSTGFGYAAARRAWQAGVAARIIPAVRDVRRFGSAALDLCWVAGGRVDAYYEWGLNPWDLSAGRIICEQAGGRVEILEGRTIVASVPDLFDPLVDLLAGAGGLAPPPGSEPRHW